MMRIKIYDAAGATVGRPSYEVENHFDVIGETHSAAIGKILSGGLKGKLLEERVEGEFELFTAPYPGVVNSYSLSFGRAGNRDKPLYREDYDKPFTIKNGGYIETTLEKADRYAEKGIDFEGNAYANRFAGKGGSDVLDGLGGGDRLDGGDGDDRVSGGSGGDWLAGGGGSDTVAGEAATT